MKNIPGFILRVFLVAVVSISLAVLAAEISIRSYEYYEKKIPFSLTLSEYLDPRYGWHGKMNFLEHADAPNTVMVIGDSYTHGEGVEPQYMYYNVIHHYAHANVWAYGGSGFGTLQEALVAEDYVPKVRPKFILLQVTSNDFTNNCWETDKHHGFSGTVFFRPYLVNGKIEYHYPKALGRLIVHSRFFYRLQKALERGYAKFSKPRIPSPGSLETENRRMDEIVKRMKQKTNGVPIVAFISNGSGEDIRRFRKIFQDNGIPFIDSVPGFFDQLQSRTPKDLTLGPGKGHWSRQAQLLIGVHLAEKLVSLGYLPDQGPIRLRDLETQVLNTRVR